MFYVSVMLRMVPLLHQVTEFDQNEVEVCPASGWEGVVAVLAR